MRADVTKAGLLYRVIPGAGDELAVLRSAAARREPVILDSVARDPQWGRYTVVACEPVRVVWGEEPLAGLAEIGRRQASGGWPVPYGPGWFGYLAYDAGRLFEHIPRKVCFDIRLPTMRFGLYDAVAVLDHQQQCWHVMAWPLIGRQQAEDRLDELCKLVTQPPVVVAGEEPLTIGRLAANMTRGEYISAVQQALAYVAAGDIYQVNLSQRFSAVFRGNPWALYERLRDSNPACYAAFLSWGDSEGRPQAVLSSSPELFLQVRGRTVLTRPIKGTRPRHRDPQRDAALREQLRDSPKDRAELAMIVDLERNDLGRVCAFGSVRVVQPRLLEAHPTVWHAVADVEGRQRQECGLVDLLRATFPGGSITGAPKVRAMQIIEQLEPSARSVYCGAIGHVGLDGNATFNLPIRTMILDGDQLHLQVGAGIVAESDPAAEYDETLAKAQGMLRAIGMETA